MQKSITEKLPQLTIMFITELFYFLISFSHYFGKKKTSGEIRKKQSAAASTYPKVVMVTMVYQNAAGMLVKVVWLTFFSA